MTTTLAFVLIDETHLFQVEGDALRCVEECVRTICARMQRAQGMILTGRCVSERVWADQSQPLSFREFPKCWEKQSSPETRRRGAFQRLSSLAARGTDIATVPRWKPQLSDVQFREAS
jgi:hypothetical protein